MAKAKKPEESQSNEEPSMEEILASIRKMITDGDEEQTAETAQGTEAKATAAPTPEETPVPAETAEEEMIELSAEALAPEPVATPAIEPAAEAEEIIELSAVIAEEAAAEEEQTHADEIASLTATDDAPMEDKLISDETDASSVAAISELTNAISRATLNIQSPGIALEDIVKETLKPLLKTWLDTHMTAIVEGIVRDEIERIMHKVVGKK